MTTFSCRYIAAPSEEIIIPLSLSISPSSPTIVSVVAAVTTSMESSSDTSEDASPLGFHWSNAWTSCDWLIVLMLARECDCAKCSGTAFELLFLLQHHIPQAHEINKATVPKQPARIILLGIVLSFWLLIVDFSAIFKVVVLMVLVNGCLISSQWMKSVNKMSHEKIDIEVNKKEEKKGRNKEKWYSTLGEKVWVHCYRFIMQCNFMGIIGFDVVWWYSMIYVVNQAHTFFCIWSSSSIS